MRRAILITALAAAAAALPAAAHAQFELGLEDAGFGVGATSAQSRTALAAAQTIRSSVVRVPVLWTKVAPAGNTVPSGFNPSNPSDPHYQWNDLDATVRNAVQHHERVLLEIYDAPRWAQQPGRPNNPGIAAGAWDPSPAAFAQFVHAAAVRYSGSFPDPLHVGAVLPRVSDWEIWNEPNLPIYLAAPDLVGEYRALLDAAYPVLKAVHRNNVVVVGGLAPVSYLAPLSMPPLQFGAELLCLQRIGTVFRAARSCPQKAEFDVYAHHPWSLAATPTKHAYDYDNVLVGDIGKIATLVHTADRLHTDSPREHHSIWVTEFGWFTNPPDQLIGDKDRVAARYVAYSLYEMWKSGVSLIIWMTVLDEPNHDPTGGGLYWNSGQPKLMLRALAFPVVASVRRDHGFVWGRVPSAHRPRLVISRKVRGRWRRIGAARAGSDGVFYFRFHARGNGLYRAHLVGGATSLAYNSAPIPGKRAHDFNTG